MRKKKFVVLSLIIVTIIVLIFCGIYWAFFDMDRLPKGNLLNEVASPNGNYSIKIYKSDGGATTSYSILGELNYIKEQKKTKNIYWNYKEDNVDVRWIDNVTVVINGHKLDIRYDIFDFRRNR